MYGCIRLMAGCRFLWVGQDTRRQTNNKGTGNSATNTKAKHAGQVSDHFSKDGNLADSRPQKMSHPLFLRVLSNKCHVVYVLFTYI